MEKNFDIVALGELLIDFTQAGLSNSGMKLFEQNPGGAPANLLTAAGHLGSKTAFIGKVGADMHGAFLKQTLNREGIDVSGVCEDKNYFTTLAFVEIGENGERRFSFARNPGADTMLDVCDLDENILSSCKIFHFGSLSLTAEPSKSATLAAIKTAKNSGALISYDPNYRASLWADEETAVCAMKEAVKFADIMKVSDEESLLLTGKPNCEEAADELLNMGVKLLAVTLGGDGVLIADKTRKETVKAFKVSPVDTTGAGDSFWGGFLNTMLSFDKSLENLSWENIKKSAVVGNSVAGLCVQNRGGIPSIPTKDAVVDFLNTKA